MNARKVILMALAVMGAAMSVLPSWADADATVAPPPVFSGVSGLPDGRMYEQVSPFNKHGSEVVVKPNIYPAGIASADGNSVVYTGSGGFGETSSAGNVLETIVSQRSAQGWTSRSALPRNAVGTGSFGPEENNDFLARTIRWLLPSADYRHFAYVTPGAAVGPPDENGSATNFYLAGPNPLVEASWIGRPSLEGLAVQWDSVAPTPFGATPDFSRIYLSWTGLMLPEDAPRAALSEGKGAGALTRPSALYEYAGGAMHEAGVLPDGSVNPFGAVPAGIAYRAATASDSFGFAPDGVGNQVSGDGSRVFFVSPQPSYSKFSAECGEHCSSEAPELYVRELLADGSHRTLLVSQSQLPGHVGEAAPDGPLAVKGTTFEDGFDAPGTDDSENERSGGVPSYVAASSDGSRVFFESVDRLTSDAPSDGEPKVYMFDLASGVLKYLPRVKGVVVGVDHSGSSLVFEDTTTSPFELDRWQQAGPPGGSVTRIALLPQPAEACQFNYFDKGLSDGPKFVAGYVSLAPSQDPICLGQVRISDDGSVVVFDTSAPIAGFNDGGSLTETGRLQPKHVYYYQQVFRYDVTSDQLSCVSCPPAGVSPSGSAVTSGIDFYQDTKDAKDIVQANRGVSPSGSRVFFESPDALVSRDSNGKRDVYEWDNGTVYLLSSGTSGENSFFIDSSQSGDDAFFVTSVELVQGDNDGAYDIYDARVPHPGDNPPPTAVPCEGDVCQGPSSVPNLLGAPSSAVFSGLGNSVPQPRVKAVKKAKPKPKSKPKHKPKKRGKHGKRGRKAARGVRMDQGNGRGK